MGLDRRSFLRFAAGAGTGIMVTPLPWKLLDDISIWSQNWSWIPSNPKGENTYISTISKLCPSACGMKVRLVGNQPVRALSNPEHPLGGGISALASAEVQLMYSPARVKAPLLRKSDGAHVQITWEEANALLAKKLKEAGSSIACITGDETGSSLDVLKDFMGKIRSKDIYLMPSEMQSASVAWNLMGGSGQLGFDIDGSDFVLSIGANYLESWGTFIANRKDFAAKHPHGEKPRGEIIYMGPVQNNTAAVADSWVPFKAGLEGIVLMGLANQLISKGRTIDAPDFEAFKALAAKYSPEQVQKLTGVGSRVMAVIADKLLAASRPIVLSGSEFNQGGGAAPVMAAVAVNLLLGNLGRKGGIQDVTLSNDARASRKAVFGNDLVRFLSSKPKAKMLMLYAANPAYALPNPKATAESIKNIPFKVSFSPFMDESAELCDLVLPSTMGLEAYDDIETPYGSAKAIYAVTTPVAPAAVKAVHGIDVLLAAAKKIGVSMPANFESVLKQKAQSLGANFKKLTAGDVFTAASGNNTSLNLRPEVLAKALERPAIADVLWISPMQKNAMGTAQSGIPPFNVKTIKGNELIGSDMAVLLNKATAESLSLKRNSKVKLTTGQGEINARVSIYEGICKDTVGVFMGFGHTALDEFSQNKGANVADLLLSSEEPGTGLSVWNQQGVRITKA